MIEIRIFYRWRLATIIKPKQRAVHYLLFINLLRMGGKSHDLFTLSFWIDSSKIDTFKDILAGKQEVPQDRIEILNSLSEQLPKAKKS